MDEDVKTDIAVIKNQMENLNDKMNRFISHLESEQRVTNNISKRVDIVENWMKWTQDNSRWKLETILAILAIVATLISNLIQLYKQ